MKLSFSLLAILHLTSGFVTTPVTKLQQGLSKRNHVSSLKMMDVKQTVDSIQEHAQSVAHTLYPYAPFILTYGITMAALSLRDMFLLPAAVPTQHSSSKSEETNKKQRVGPGIQENHL